MNKYFLLLLNIILAVVGQYLFKKGLSTTQISLSLKSILGVVFSPLIFAGFIAYGLGSILWLFVLKKFPLSVAYPSLSISYVLIVLISFLFLGEPITAKKVIGVCSIIVGVWFLS